MSEIFHDLPHGLYEWVEQSCGGCYYTFGTTPCAAAKRGSWTSRHPDGNVTEGFLRLDRNPIKGSATSLYKEAMICQALDGH